jgi:hypothetical protein
MSRAEMNKCLVNLIVRRGAAQDGACEGVPSLVVVAATRDGLLSREGDRR